MKTLKRDLCEVAAEGETFEALKPHYFVAHAEVMKDPELERQVPS